MFTPSSRARPAFVGRKAQLLWSILRNHLLKDEGEVAKEQQDTEKTIALDVVGKALPYFPFVGRRDREEVYDRHIFN